MKNRETSRGMRIGAEIIPEGGVHFRVWAPRRRTVEVVIEDGAQPQSFELQPEPEGYFSGLVAAAGAGTRYRFRLDGGDSLFPDPASRFQPEGPHGPSQVVDPHGFKWSDDKWPGVGIRSQVIYELHLGTFTPEGTFAAAARELPELASLGVTVIELMPVSEFPGKFGWGYDGVNSLPRRAFTVRRMICGALLIERTRRGWASFSMSSTTTWPGRKLFVRVLKRLFLHQT